MAGGRPKGSLNKRGAHTQAILNCIRGKKLVNALQAHVLGTKKLEMSQVKAASVLLQRILPSLTSTDLNVDGELGTYAISGEAKSAEQWEREAADHLGATAGPPEAPH